MGCADHFENNVSSVLIGAMLHAVTDKQRLQDTLASTFMQATDQDMGFSKRPQACALLGMLLCLLYCVQQRWLALLGMPLCIASSVYRKDSRLAISRRKHGSFLPRCLA